MRTASIAVAAVLLTAAFVALRVSTGSDADLASRGDRSDAAMQPDSSGALAATPGARETAAVRGTPARGGPIGAGDGGGRESAAVPGFRPPVRDRPAPARTDATDTRRLVADLADPNPKVHEPAARLLAESRDPSLVARLWDRFFEDVSDQGGQAPRILDLLESLDQEVDQARAFLDYADPADLSVLSDELRRELQPPPD